MKNEKLIPRPTEWVETSESKPTLQSRKSDSMSLKNYFENAKYVCGFTHN